MFTLIGQSGIYGSLILLLIIISIAYLFLSIMNMVKFKKESNEKVEDNINNIIRMGVLSAALGFLGTIHGGYLAINEILAATEISMRIVWEGVICALSSTVLGFQVFAVTAVIWFVLRNILRRLN